MTRVPFGVTSSPFLLAATIQHHLKKHEGEKPLACQTLKESLYVDDLLAGAENVYQAHEVTKDATEILQKAGMNMRKWRTNSKELRDLWALGQNDTSSNVEQNCLIKTNSKVLGLTWREDTDVFVFDLETLLQFLTEAKNTKRFVLQASARIFDPIGFLTPFTIRVKCLFQEMWERGLSWDSELPADLSSSFKNWCHELPELRHVSVPRHYYGNTSKSDIQDKQIHCFCDASERAYAAVIYVRYINANGSVGVCFVTSKARVAPLKKVTLPRLELMGCLLGSRLTSRLMKIFSLEHTCVQMWTDSMIALQWIKGSARKWKPFVANRVIEIQSKTDPQFWNHCKGTDNPADLPTRGQNAEVLASSVFLWEGPPWLHEDKSNWPKDSGECSYPPPEEERTKVAKQIVLSAHLDQKTGNALPLLELTNFSGLRKLLRVTAWIQRFANNTRNLKNKLNGPLTAEEVISAKKFWIKKAQEDEYGNDVKALKEGRIISQESKIKNLNPMLDNDGLMCVGGRLQKAEFSYQEKHPWIISSKHRIFELIAIFHHERLMHGGLRDTLTDIRENSWVPKGRQAVKSIIQRCLICKAFMAKPGKMVMAPLPVDRIRECPPFDVTGIDFAGPLFTKGANQTHKTYVVLFTCAVTRAIHLELASTLSTEMFLLAFRRFIARRGVPSIVYSDNAMTFKRADKDLREMWKVLKCPETQELFGTHGITWKFIVERAAWWGGFWERLVRSVKSALKKGLGRASLTYEELETLLLEVEAILNSRPLTFVYNDCNEPAPLTPGHFLTGDILTTLPTRRYTAEDVSPSKEQLTRRLKYREGLKESMWKRWKRDYLLELRTAHQAPVIKGCTEFQIGDVVLVHEDKTPRLAWKMARVTEAIKGRDGLVRSYRVKLSSGRELRRPVQLLYHLEL